MTTDDLTRVWQEIGSLRRDRHELGQRVQKLFSDFDGHLMLCTERHKEIGEKLDLLLSIVRWVAALAVVTMLGALTFFIKRDLFP